MTMDFSFDEYSAIETPFNYRYSCWFCGEPAGKQLYFPHQHVALLRCTHAKLTLNSCKECLAAAHKSHADNIWQLRIDVKAFLIKHYHKDLAIGINWTQQELAESQFEGGNFESFQQSAWFMFEVARDRVNFSGWPIVVNGITLAADDYIDAPFSYQGTQYPSIKHAIDYYTQVHELTTGYLASVIARVGDHQFAFAIRLCLEMKAATTDERLLALQSLEE